MVVKQLALWFPTAYADLSLAAHFDILFSQKHFTCAEANLGPGSSSLPLIVMAISESLVGERPWPAYAEHYSKFEESLQGETLQGHFNSKVRAAAAEVSGKMSLLHYKGVVSRLFKQCKDMSCQGSTEASTTPAVLLAILCNTSACTDVSCLVQLPLQQLAWLMSDQPCRLMICGKGPAGAVAQHAAMTLQQMLQLPMSDQVTYDNGCLTLQSSFTRYGTLGMAQTCSRFYPCNQSRVMVRAQLLLQEICKLPERVLCITFGAPPSSLHSPDDDDDVASDMVSAKPVVPQLIWNFLLANAASNVKEQAENAMRQWLPLADIMPAVLSTRPNNIASANAWIDAATALQKVASDRRTDQDDLKESIDRVLAAGTVNRLM